MEITYDRNTALTETALVTIKAGKNGCYSGETAAAFRIYEKDIKAAKVRLVQTTAYYDGTQKTPAIESVTLAGQTLPEGEYTVSYGRNVEKGTGTVILTGTGEYGGTREVKFLILPKWLQNLLDAF